MSNLKKTLVVLSVMIVGLTSVSCKGEESKSEKSTDSKASVSESNEKSTALSSETLSEDNSKQYESQKEPQKKREVTRPESIVGNENLHPEYEFTAEENDFLNKSVFIGDSICLGLKVFDILPDERVFAGGGVGVHDILGDEYALFEDGKTYDEVCAEFTETPENIIFSMGMNDYRMMTKEAFAEGYIELLKYTQEKYPDANLYVVSGTPVDVDSDFIENEKIDEYNNASKTAIENAKNDKWHFINVAKALKNENGDLKEGWHSGDGLHLGPDAYYAYLDELTTEVV